MKIKKTLMVSLGMLAIASPILTTISCGSDTNYSAMYADIKQYSKEIKNIDFKQKNKTFDISKITALAAYDAEIISWVDGDTPTIKYDQEIQGKKQWNIRLTGIDTPELHYLDDKGDWVDTSGEEFKWASKAKEFGEHEMPVGTKIKVLTSGTLSYTRMVGSLFYKKPSETKYKSYSVEILRNGLCMPFFNDKVAEVNIESTLINNTGIAMADAYNDSIKNLKGIFSVDTGKVLNHHGETSDTRIRYRIGKRFPDEQKNIYEIAHIVYDK